MTRRSLSDEEEGLWRMVTQSATKLESRQVAPLPTPQAKPQVRGVGRPALPAVPIAMLPPLALGAYAGVDRRMAQRFRGGELVIDGTVDLHGMSREKAHHAVIHFIHDHYARGSRCLLAITGKGLRKGTEQETGVLREMLPLWLAEPGLRPFVLACDVARPKHGGGGAYYILLRRKR
ncbi:MAG: DNA mismatch repair protein MutS [Proteobacteria bacterium]|nr:DNA mismatch repair protein MutS [Pseudomonadota bacterium]